MSTEPTVLARKLFIFAVIVAARDGSPDHTSETSYELTVSP